MTPEQKRTFNTGVGAMFIVLGFVTWGMTAYYASTPAPEQPAPTVASRVNLAACRATLGRLGFTTSDSAGRVIGKLPDVPASYDEMVDVLNKSSVAATVCSMEMTRFCMGEGCKSKGLEMELSDTLAERVIQKQATPSDGVASGAQASAELPPARGGSAP